MHTITFRSLLCCSCVEYTNEVDISSSRCQQDMYSIINVWKLQHASTTQQQSNSIVEARHHLRGDAEYPELDINMMKKIKQHHSSSFHWMPFCTPFQVLNKPSGKKLQGKNRLIKPPVVHVKFIIGRGICELHTANNPWDAEKAAFSYNHGMESLQNKQHINQNKKYNCEPKTLRKRLYWKWPSYNLLARIQPGSAFFSYWKEQTPVPQTFPRNCS